VTIAYGGNEIGWIDPRALDDDGEICTAQGRSRGSARRAVASRGSAQATTASPGRRQAVRYTDDGQVGDFGEARLGLPSGPVARARAGAHYLAEQHVTMPHPAPKFP